ncbi:MAG: hypothetical protein ACYCTE_13455, partial [Acidimicrobiales bacterium]
MLAKAADQRKGQAAGETTIVRSGTVRSGTVRSGTVRRSSCRTRVACAATTLAILSGGVVTGAGVADAAGTGYGGAPPIPSAVPGGFRAVATAVDTTKAGRVVALRFSGTSVRIAVPKGAAPRGEQIVVTRATAAAILPRDLRRVPATYRSARAIFAIGLLFDRYGSPFVNDKFVVVRIASPKFRRAFD